MKEVILKKIIGFILTALSIFLVYYFSQNEEFFKDYKVVLIWGCSFMASVGFDMMTNNFFLRLFGIKKK